MYYDNQGQISQKQSSDQKEARSRHSNNLKIEQENKVSWRYSYNEIQKSFSRRQLKLKTDEKVWYSGKRRQLEEEVQQSEQIMEIMMETDEVKRILPKKHEKTTNFDRLMSDSNKRRNIWRKSDFTTNNQDRKIAVEDDQ